MSRLEALIAFGMFLVSFAIFDTWLALDGEKANTVSAGLRWLAKIWAPSRIIFIFAMGMICGHLYWT